MHDFDAGRRERHQQREKPAEERSFVFSGEVFTYRNNVPFDVLHDITAVNERTPGSDVIARMVSSVKGMLENTVTELPPELWDEPAEGQVPVAKMTTAHQRFDLVCRRDAEFPVTFEDLQELQNWMIGQAVNRPTVPPSPSGPGQQSSGNGSTDTSSTEAETVSAA